MIKYLLTGTFDPLTAGHVDLLLRSSRLCDVVCIAIMENTEKKNMFSIDKRLQLWKTVIADLCARGDLKPDRVELVHSSGLVVDVVRELNITAIVRGVRNSVDFAYENQMAEVNRSQLLGCETIFLAPRPDKQHISSSIVRELILRGGDYRAYVPEVICDLLSDRED